MKKLLFPLSGLLFAATIAQADTIATWSFEAGQNSALVTANVTALSTGPIASDVGVGSYTGVHASAATVWSAPAGDANAAYPSSQHSSSANNWTKSDYFQFTVNLDQATKSFSGIGLSWDQMGSNTGPRTWQLQYSTDNFATSAIGLGYDIVNGNWSTTLNAPSHETLDLSLVTALNTASTLYFRVVENSDITGGAITGGNVSGTGTGRIDNFTITALVNPIPEPATVALFGLGLLALNVIRRRK